MTVSKLDPATAVDETKYRFQICPKMGGKLGWSPAHPPLVDFWIFASVVDLLWSKRKRKRPRTLEASKSAKGWSSAHTPLVDFCVRGRVAVAKLEAATAVTKLHDGFKT